MIQTATETVGNGNKKKRLHKQSLQTQNRDQPEVRLSVDTFEVDVLAHLIVAILASSPGSFHRRLFRILVQKRQLS